MSFTLSSMKYSGVGRYKTQLWSKRKMDMDANEKKKWTIIEAHINKVYPDVYNPLRDNESYINFATVNDGIVVLELKKYYDLILRLQSYKFNNETRLRLILESSELGVAPKPTEYTNVELPEF